jgi:hypothetical protein
MGRRRNCATIAAQLDEAEPATFTAGRASVHVGGIAPDDTGDGRAEVMDGRSLTSWVVWDWSRAVDDKLETLAADVYDLADRVHYLNVTVMVAFLVQVLALSIVIGVVVL